MFDYYGAMGTDTEYVATVTPESEKGDLEMRAVLPSGLDKSDIADFQRVLNAGLASLGCTKIVVDGSFGPQTCGAAAYLSKAAPNKTPSNVTPGGPPTWSTLCASLGRSYSCNAAQVTAPTTTTPVVKKASGGNTGLYVALGVLGLLGLGGLYLATKKKGRR